MAKTFRPYERDQLRLMPPALADWVPEGHLARFVSDLVDGLDLTAIEDTYAEERGYPPYHPRMMVTVLRYAYCTGTYSSRKIAARLEDSVAFRFLAAENQPDFRTISDFRKRNSAALAGLFTQVLRVCRQAGLVRLGRGAIDGTRMKANASKHKAMSYGRMVEKDAALQREIAELLRRAEQVDRDEDAQHGPDRRGDELPAELARRESRRQKIREAKAALEAEAQEQATRAGKDPAQATPEPKAQRNFTDPESKIQKTTDGFIQGYNAQAAVDATAQVIGAQDVTPMAADVGHLMPLVTAISRTFRPRPRQVLADAGYCSDDNLKALEAETPTPRPTAPCRGPSRWLRPGRSPPTTSSRIRQRQGPGCRSQELPARATPTAVQKPSFAPPRGAGSGGSTGRGVGDQSAAGGLRHPVQGHFRRGEKPTKAGGGTGQSGPTRWISTEGNLPNIRGPRAIGTPPGTADTPRHPGIGLGTPSGIWGNRAGPRSHTRMGAFGVNPIGSMRDYPRDFLDFGKGQKAGTHEHMIAVALVTRILGRHAPPMTGGAGVGTSEDAIRAVTPAGRRGMLKEVMAATLYLASEAATYVTGQTLVVDGGWTAA